VPGNSLLRAGRITGAVWWTITLPSRAAALSTALLLTFCPWPWESLGHDCWWPVSSLHRDPRNGHLTAASVTTNSADAWVLAAAAASMSFVPSMWPIACFFGDSAGLMLAHKLICCWSESEKAER